uniref:Uncharacterized protein n=1 Tax=Rhizophora mucronata TaxID=61149 RepID=A0A2P2N3D4_RHIMU
MCGYNFSNARSYLANQLVDHHQKTLLSHKVLLHNPRPPS